MGQRPGGTAVKVNLGTDIYFTFKAARFMFDFILKEIFFKKIHILDACCGPNGVLGNALRSVIAEKAIMPDFFMDFVDQKNFHKIGFRVEDILKWNKRGYDFIVCNPPWQPAELAFSIYQHLKTLLSPRGVLFFIINVAFSNSNIGRMNTLQESSSVLLPRFTFKESLMKRSAEKKKLFEKGIIEEFKPSTGLTDPMILIYANEGLQSRIETVGCVPIPREYCYGKDPSQFELFAEEYASFN